MMVFGRRAHAGCIIALAMTGALTACADEAEIPPETEQLVRGEGAAAAGALVGTLQANLMASMKEGGPTRAVEFCAGEALALTDSVSRELGDGIQLKRVSENHRNPANAPDQAELAALRYFEGSLAEYGSLPEDWVQQTSSGELRYYRPLVITEPCLTCHGKVENMDPAVAEAIRTRYPEDRGTGYEVGDLRGLIRVIVSRSSIP